MEKEITDFLEKLKDAKRQLLRKRGFMAEHNFIHEQAYLNTKISVVEEIIFSLEDVVNKTKRGIDINFTF